METTNTPKIILNLTDIDFTDRQIREVYDEDYRLIYPAEPLEFAAKEDEITATYIDCFVQMIQDELNEVPYQPDCVILDVPKQAIPPIASEFIGSNINFIYTQSTFVKFVDGDILEVKSLRNVEA